MIQTCRISFVSFFLLSFFLSFYSSSKHNNTGYLNYGQPNKKYIFKEDKTKYDSLFTIYGKNKKLPKGFEVQAIVALSHFPELIDKHIEFRIQKAKIAHTSRPNFASIFKHKDKRKYYITISNLINKNLENTRLVNLSYNAQIGVLGHELSHIVDYSNFTSMEIIKYGLKYIFEKGIVKIENRTDSIAIRHGLGYQLMDWSKEVHQLHIQDGRGDRYLAPKEIEELISNNKLYLN